MLSQNQNFFFGSKDKNLKLLWCWMHKICDSYEVKLIDLLKYK